MCLQLAKCVQPFVVVGVSISIRIFNRNIFSISFNISILELDLALFNIIIIFVLH